MKARHFKRTAEELGVGETIIKGWGKIMKIKKDFERRLLEMCLVFTPL